MKIDNHIKHKRQEFDAIEKVPADAIWIGIEHKLQKRARRVRMLRIAIAASIILALTAPFLIDFNQSTSTDNIVESNPVLIESEKQYYRLASDKKDEMGYARLDPDLYEDLFTELDLLDSMYNDLKAEISNSPDAERAIETAIRFHERRLHILDLLEKEIENQKRLERHESTVKI